MISSTPRFRNPACCTATNSTYRSDASNSSKRKKEAARRLSSCVYAALMCWPVSNIVGVLMLQLLLSKDQRNRCVTTESTATMSPYLGVLYEGIWYPIRTARVVAGITVSVASVSEMHLSLLQQRTGREL